MTMYRRTAMAVTACAAGLSVAACTAGVTTAHPASSPSPGPSTAAGHARSSPGASPSRTSPAAVPGDTVSVDAPIGTFPIPRGARIIDNMTCAKQVIIELGAVTPATVSSFYNSVLPRDGFKITGNTMVDGTGNGLPGSVAEINFSGHGYKGQIAALANMGALASTGPSPVSVPESIAKNFITISLTPRGAAGCPG